MFWIRQDGERAAVESRSRTSTTAERWTLAFGDEHMAMGVSYVLRTGILCRVPLFVRPSPNEPGHRDSGCS